MSRLTPLETQIVMQLACALVGAGVPVTALRVFGSRARGHSNEHSDLDIAVVLASPPDPSLTRRVLDLGHAVSIETDVQGLRVQAVPFFWGEESGPLARSIAAEARTVWTRT
jgi:predicted nucleotidyltransferase